MMSRWNGTLGLALATLVAGIHAQQPSFSVAIDAVQVDVLVTRNGDPISGLTAADFELRDNGVVQQIDAVTREELPLDVFLALDTSESVRGEPLRALVSAARVVLDHKAPNDRVALLTFSERVRGPVSLTPDSAHVTAALDRIVTAGSTSLLDAVYGVLVLQHATRGRALVLLFSDGRDTSSWFRPATVLDLARRTDAVVYAIELERGSRKVPNAPLFLEELAATTGGRVLRTGDMGTLRDLFAQAVREMKTRYILTYTPRGVVREGWHTLEVKLARGDGDVTARRGYLVPGQPPTR